MDELIIVGLAFFAFFAGLIDAAVGGGGLIQIPALMNFLPQAAPATVFGTNKLASIFGTGSAAFNFIRKVRFPWLLLALVACFAGIFAWLGAQSVSLVPQQVLRPVVLVLLILIAVYTFKQKQFGQTHQQFCWSRRSAALAILGAAAIGFYDGIFGPGTGSFFIFFFIRYLSFDFLHASALAKVANLMTNLAALSFFVPTGHVLWQIGLVMAAANILGAVVGVRLVFKWGTQVIRRLFMVLLAVLIGRLFWQMVVD